MKMIKRLRENLTFNIISAVVILLIIFSWIVSAIGYISFTNAFKREVSGLGIFLVNKNMDSLLYEYKDNKNIMTMKEIELHQ